MDFMHYLKTRTASLLTELDKRLLVVLRDGKTFIGELSSVDQFANLVLENTIERIHVGKQYGDIHRGVFVVRGENVVLLGEVDSEKEAASNLIKVSIDDILEAQRRDMLEKEEQEKAKNMLRHERGLPPHMPDMGLDDFA
ncbi:U6 snRNA-associated Sm-like protein LSm1 [Hydractinia symbiolongicarpus]|uniref:U6 snRNA-associated Sm-like protein LSm1 n=1 Tax=Hydractinia symbiolongicarpus TaxID=13093 RepID=UPI00254FD43B|nr:U6 snRNA-associated Sm-like protein LSm1 [Hydractinia symbiolongicarpus]